MSLQVGFLHYTAPPVVGGVEAVIAAHARAFLDAGYPVTVVAGRGSQEALPGGACFVHLPEIDSQHPSILDINRDLEQGRVPVSFAPVQEQLQDLLRPVLAEMDVLIVHNVFSKHFNLPLTAALAALIEEPQMPCFLAWCHDISWTSANSRSKVFSGFPWDLLRTYNPQIQYIAISKQRKAELVDGLRFPEQKVDVVYNGVDPSILLGLSKESWELVQRLDLFSADPALLMPVRVTQGKNIEMAARVAAALKARGSQPRIVVTGPPDPHDVDSMEYYRGLLRLRQELGVEHELRFVFESGPASGQPHYIEQQVVGELLRVCDALFMPSLREGFGMPVLEASLVGLPVISSANVPASLEIGEENVIVFDGDATPEEIAEIVLREVVDRNVYRMRAMVRRTLTWERVFREKIEPYIECAKE